MGGIGSRNCRIRKIISHCNNNDNIPPWSRLGYGSCCFTTSLIPLSSTSSDAASESFQQRKSVTGLVYEATTHGSNTATTAAPVVKLFTKDGCTLCDKVKLVLANLRHELPHTLELVDITDPDHEMYWNKYKYDIPVLHVNDQFWIKHRLDEQEARQGLEEAIQNTFVARPGEPDAGAMEQRQAARQQQQQQEIIKPSNA